MGIANLVENGTLTVFLLCGIDTQTEHPRTLDMVDHSHTASQVKSDAINRKAITFQPFQPERADIETLPLLHQGG